MKKPILPACPNRALSAKEAAALLGIDQRTLRRQESEPDKFHNIPVPPKYKFSNNRVGYYLDDVMATIEARKAFPAKPKCDNDSR